MRSRWRAGRVRAVVVGAVAAGAVLAGALALGRAGSPAPPASQPAPAPRPEPTADWRPMAASPLGGRANAVGVWTGTELVVAGGEEGPVCPPAADCLRSGTPSAAAAAYDPVADTWRSLPPAPEPFAAGFGVRLGDRALFVATSGAGQVLDLGTGTWTRVADLPGPVADGGLIVADGHAVRFGYASRGGAPADYRLDPDSGTWTALPRDPFGESYDRSLAWLDGRLWLLSMAAEHHFDAYRGRPSRLAVLDGERWRVVDAATPPLTQLQVLMPQGDLLVVAENRDPAARGRAYDPARDRWRELPSSPPGDGGCDLGRATAGPEWVTARDRLVSAGPADALPVPRCPERAGFALVVWAGERLVRWGGVPTMTSSEPSGGGEVWIPRRPGEPDN